MRLRQFRVEHCSLADKEHQESGRQYAHVFHRNGAICVSSAFESLPTRLKIAILLHETGHLLAGPRGGEDAANRSARDVFRCEDLVQGSNALRGSVGMDQIGGCARAKKALGL